jgi:transcriptional regulator with XRE-family HTH domain
VPPKSHLKVPFGLVLRERRLAAGLSQEGLADMSDLHRTYVSQLERGLKAPSLAAIEAVAGALRVAPHVLVRDAEFKAAGSSRK